MTDKHIENAMAEITKYTEDVAQALARCIATVTEPEIQKLVSAFTQAIDRALELHCNPGILQKMADVIKAAEGDESCKT